MRRLDEDHVEYLKAQIRASGQRLPITVRCKDGKHTLVAGLHRLTAMKALRYTHIEAFIREYGDQEARLEEIIENLDRKDLTYMEKAEAHSEIVCIMFERGYIPDMDCRKARRIKVAETAGISVRMIQIYCQITKYIPTDIRDLIRQTPVADNKDKLLFLACAAKNNEGVHRLAQCLIDGVAINEVAMGAHTKVDQTEELDQNLLVSVHNQQDEPPSSPRSVSQRSVS